MEKPEKKVGFRGDAGKLMLDVGKLAIGGVIIGGILQVKLPPVILIIGGTFAALALFAVGFHWIEKDRRYL